MKMYKRLQLSRRCFHGRSLGPQTFRPSHHLLHFIMLAQTLLLAALPSLALAKPQPMGTRGMRCSNGELTEEQKALYLKIATHKKDALAEPFNVPTYFHVLQEDETTGALSVRYTLSSID